ncbi:hypothetical protein ACLKA6_013391 [Drosophila palustris]
MRACLGQNREGGSAASVEQQRSISSMGDVADAKDQKWVILRAVVAIGTLKGIEAEVEVEVEAVFEAEFEAEAETETGAAAVDACGLRAKIVAGFKWIEMKANEKAMKCRSSNSYSSSSSSSSSSRLLLQKHSGAESRDEKEDKMPEPYPIAQAQ